MPTATAGGGTAGLNGILIGSPTSLAPLSAALGSSGYASLIRQARAAELHLRSLVRQMSSCLPEMAPELRQVLIMRAGLYGAAQTPGEVAARLRIGVRQEHLSEAVAVLELQWAAAHGGCGSGSASMAALLNPFSSPFASSFLPPLSGAQSGQDQVLGVKPGHSKAASPASASAGRRLALQSPAINWLLHSPPGNILLFLGALALLAVIFAAATGYWTSARRRRVRAILAEILEQDPSDFYRRLTGAMTKANGSQQRSARAVSSEATTGLGPSRHDPDTTN